MLLPNRQYMGGTSRPALYEKEIRHINQTRARRMACFTKWIVEKKMFLDYTLTILIIIRTAS